MNQSSKRVRLMVATLLLTAGCTSPAVSSPVASPGGTQALPSATPVELSMVRPATQGYACGSDDAGTPTSPARLAVPDAAAAIAAARQASLDHETARSMGWEPPARPRAAAALMPYGLALGMAGSTATGPGAGNSCVWLVTLEEPYLRQQRREGAEPKLYSSYSSVIVAASGESVGLFAGTKAPNLITGKNLAKPCPVGETPWPQ